MRKFLLIGGAGTIGRNLHRYLIEKDEIVKSVDAIYQDENYVDILNPSSLDNVISNYEPTHVIMLAAAVGRVFNESDHNNSINTNVMGAYNVIQACLTYKTKITYIGTSEAYGSRFGSGHQYPADEFAVPTDFPIFKGIYGFTKLVAEKLVEHYTINHNLESSVCRLFMCYAADGAVRNNNICINRMLISAMSNKKIEVHKETSRAWCYVDDIVEGIYLVAIKGNRLYNIGKPDERISSIDLAKKIIKITKSKSKINLIEPDHDIYKHKHFHIKLAESIGFKPKVTLNEGLQWVYSAIK